MQTGDSIQGAAYYYDDYCRMDGEWKISSSRYVRLYEQIVAVDGTLRNLKVTPSRGQRT